MAKPFKDTAKTFNAMSYLAMPLARKVNSLIGVALDAPRSGYPGTGRLLVAYRNIKDLAPPDKFYSIKKRQTSFRLFGRP